MSFGDLYKWGRSADGHQLRTSSTDTIRALNFYTNVGIFITSAVVPFNWLINAQTHMWSGTSAENNPCPSGFRIPTAAEWNQERLTWSSNDAAGVFSSPLKLPLAGFRNFDGSFNSVNNSGYYWSSTASGDNSVNLNFNISNTTTSLVRRAVGASVRCIKD